MPPAPAARSYISTEAQSPAKGPRHTKPKTSPREAPAPENRALRPKPQSTARPASSESRLKNRMALRQPAGHKPAPSFYQRGSALDRRRKRLSASSTDTRRYEPRTRCRQIAPFPPRLARQPSADDRDNRCRDAVHNSNNKFPREPGWQTRETQGEG